MDYDKEFDGIKQADNPMPEWWKLFFGLAIVFAVGYTIYFHWFSDWKMEDSFSKEVAEYEAKFPMAKVIVSADGSNPLRDKADAIEEGKKNFQNFCVACHGPEAKGLVGPNLTDAEWIHGDNDAAIYEVIMEGVAGEKAKLGRGAMPPHKTSLGSERVYQVMAWLATNNPSMKKLK